MLYGAFKIASNSKPKNIYLDHYRRKWIPETTLLQIISLEFGLDTNTWRTLVGEGTFNNYMSNGDYKKTSVNEDYGTGLFQINIKYNPGGEKESTDFRFYYIAINSEKPSCNTE